MAQINLSKAPKFIHAEMIKTIAKEKGISEAAVRTVLEGFAQITLRKISEGKVVVCHNLGMFWASRKITHCQWLPKGHPDRDRENVSPRFRPHRKYKQSLQALMGYRISMCHMNSKDVDPIRQDSNGTLQLDKVKPPKPITSAFDSTHNQS